MLLAAPNDTNFASILQDAVSGEFNHESARVWAGVNLYPTIYVSIASAYLLSIFSIEFAMKSRTPFHLRLPLASWNAVQSIFSFVVVYNTIPEAIDSWNMGGYYGLNCSESCMVGAVGAWHFAFLASKAFDLIDTYFIVLRKRPLIFLHYYHHVLTLVMGMYSYWLGFPARLVTICNGSVHTIMYGYYALRAVDVKVPGWVARAITRLQISQFIVACFSGVYMTKMWMDNTGCMRTATIYHICMLWIANFVFLYLFVDFFRKAYVHNGGRDKYRDTPRTFCVPEHSAPVEEERLKTE